MMQPVALLGQQSVAPPLPASQFDPSSSFNVQPSPSFNVQPTPSLNFNPAPAFSFSSPGINPMMQPVSILDQQVFNTPQPTVNPMMQPVSILDQQVFNAPQPSINFDPFSSFNVEPSPAFSFPDPVVNPMMQPVPVLGQPMAVTNVDLMGNPLREQPSVEEIRRRSDADRLGGNSTLYGNQQEANAILKGTLEGLGKGFMDVIKDPIQAISDATGFYSDPIANYMAGAEGGLPRQIMDAIPNNINLPALTKETIGDAGLTAIEYLSGYDQGKGGYDFNAETLRDLGGSTGDTSPVNIAPGVEESTRSAALNTQAAQELSRLMEGVGNNSPQANFLAEKAQGDLTSKQIADANAFAKSIGTTFDPELGYSRAPFLESQAVQPQVTQEQLQQLASPGRIAPMGRDATKARIAQLSGLSSPATLNQAITNNPNAVMSTDAQGRIRSFASPQAVQQNLTNAQTSFDQASRDRLTRLEQRDVRPGETITERDTRIADSRTEGSDRGGEMSFEEARKFVPKGQKETAKSYNERVKSFRAQQNSTINKLKEEYEQYRVQGQVLNNQRTNALIANYQQTQPEKYKQVFATAQEMLKDGILKDQTQMAMYVIDTMGGKSSDIFDPSVEFYRGGDDGGAQTYTQEQEVRIERFMKANGLGREDALRELRNAKKIQ